jgi:hypothetical protein
VKLVFRGKHTGLIGGVYRDGNNQPAGLTYPAANWQAEDNRKSEAALDESRRENCRRYEKISGSVIAAAL